jgi:hypothetical protein
MFDEHQIPSSGKFGISNLAAILSVITLSSGLTTVLVFVEESEDEKDVTDAKPLGMRLSQASRGSLDFTEEVVVKGC